MRERHARHNSSVDGRAQLTDISAEMHSFLAASSVSGVYLNYHLRTPRWHLLLRCSLTHGTVVVEKATGETTISMEGIRALLTRGYPRAALLSRVAESPFSEGCMSWYERRRRRYSSRASRAQVNDPERKVFRNPLLQQQPLVVATSAEPWCTQRGARGYAEQQAINVSRNVFPDSAGWTAGTPSSRYPPAWHTICLELAAAVGAQRPPAVSVEHSRLPKLSCGACDRWLPRCRCLFLWRHRVRSSGLFGDVPPSCFHSRIASFQQKLVL